MANHRAVRPKLLWISRFNLNKQTTLIHTATRNTVLLAAAQQCIKYFSVIAFYSSLKWGVAATVLGIRVSMVLEQKGRDLRHACRWTQTRVFQWNLREVLGCFLLYVGCCEMQRCLVSVPCAESGTSTVPYQKRSSKLISSHDGKV